MFFSDEENSIDNKSFLKMFDNISNSNVNELELNESNLKEQKINDECENSNKNTGLSNLKEEETNDIKENYVEQSEILFYENHSLYENENSKEKLNVIDYNKELKKNNCCINFRKKFYENDELYNNICDENLNKNYLIKLFVKKKPARKDYLIKKMLSIISKFLIKKLKEKNNKFKKINLKTELNYEKLKICLNIKIEKLLKKNDSNEELIKLYENNENLNEILNIKLIEFINNNYETLNNQYKDYYYNEFKLKFENAKLFQNFNSINNLINEIISTKGNKTK